MIYLYEGIPHALVHVAIKLLGIYSKSSFQNQKANCWFDFNKYFIISLLTLISFNIFLRLS